MVYRYKYYWIHYKRKKKLINRDTHLHSLTRNLQSSFRGATIQKPLNLRVIACNRVSYLLIFSFIGMYPVILVSIKIINHKIIWRQISYSTCLQSIKKSLKRTREMNEFF